MKVTPVVASCTLLLLASGCIDEKCDPGFARLRGACFPTMVDLGPRPSDAGSGDDADAGSEPPEVDECPRGEGFGVACASDAECECGTQCIPVLNFCSVLNCHDYDEPICPESWECRDISAASTDPNVTSICLEP